MASDAVQAGQEVSQEFLDYLAEEAGKIRGPQQPLTLAGCREMNLGIRGFELFREWWDAGKPMRGEVA